MSIAVFWQFSEIVFLSLFFIVIFLPAMHPWRVRLLARADKINAVTNAAICLQHSAGFFALWREVLKSQAARMSSAPCRYDLDWEA